MSVFAQSDSLQLQKYLIEPIVRPCVGEVHPAEALANQCLCAGEVKWSALMNIAKLLPQPRQNQFVNSLHSGNEAPRTFMTGACARGPNVGLTRNMCFFSSCFSDAGYDHSGHRPDASLQLLYFDSELARIVTAT